MSCFHPITCKNPSKQPQITGRNVQVTVPCGKCVGCKQDYTNSFAHRLIEEAKDCVQCVFVTLTYAPEYLPEGNVLVKKHLQAFLKRFDTKMRGYYEPSPHVHTKMPYKYAACGEYGGENGRAHYHVIFFFRACSWNRKFPVDWRDISNCWAFYDRRTKKYVRYGRVQIELPRSEKNCCAYIAKYSQKQLYEEYNKEEQAPFSLRSHGLGDGFLWREGPQVYRQNVRSFRNEKGYSVKFHRYYITKLFGISPAFRTEEENLKCVLYRVKMERDQKERDEAQFREYLIFHHGMSFGDFLLWRVQRSIEKERVMLQRLADKEKKRKSSRRIRNFDKMYLTIKQVYG